ncbi:MAG: Asp23/Gls24 family envelope stress response protein [Candidatus Omnitrophica bacterium]|nr:Asp23/Gls24 family envelope stress response protein [Candidatus Omnitrophota bacterium]MBU0881389.1 Asp23/Gls24 family envelope stress response protein [Candidatus Omnitrophota bacterium]MBU0895751.1 Asp23/Gls24 family envelope stress response protein [Candidatus Omnitrophota bacterium]MBU1038424.1 Asp23/Gls24 family envelope stress response protein [Candidatus Omnitrophota bacterium]MBU1809452.1 Asp23/Gls24 family envelope stress response protein [Candidatus Omnitrophota bacterium]
MTNDITHRERTTDLGVVRINNEAITTIASVAAMEVKGVHKMGGGIKKALHEVFLRGHSSSGVKISVKDSEIKLVVSIIVDYGIDIPRVADGVQDSVKHAVEKMTGLVMSEVDVVVDGVYTPSLYDKDKRRGSNI